MVWWAFIKLNKKLNGLYVELNLLCLEVKSLFKAAVPECMKLERVRGGTGRFDILRNSWEGLWDAVSPSLCWERSPQCLLALPQSSCPGELSGCRNSWTHLLQAIHGSRKRHFSTQELQVTLSWTSSVNCACLGLPGSVLRGFSCGLATGTPQLPYSWLPFIMSSTFSCCWTEVSFAAHSAGYVLSFSQGAWETIVSPFLTKSLHSHSRQEVKQFKCLQISFLFSLCPKQAPDVELQKKQTDFLFVEGGIQVDYIIFFPFTFLVCSAVRCRLECFDKLLAKRLPSCDNLSFVCSCDKFVMNKEAYSRLC